ncbi:MAG: sugar ABC transporter substrate-binding protein [Clostridiales bacterium]|nr:sugar ABC transporter substrate-binding protein [Clostridiales bacterium]
MKRRTHFLNRENLRKVSAGALVCAMAFSLAACGSSSGSTSEADTTDATSSEAETESTTASASADLNANTSGATEVSMWHYFEGEDEVAAITQICNEYNASQDVIYVVPEYVAREELMNQYTIGAISGELPDIGMVDSPDMASYISLGVFENITAELEEWGELDNFYDANMSSCQDADGNLYGLPQNTNCLALAVNMDLLEAAGYDSAPTSIDEFYEMALALTDPDDSTYGFAMSAVATEEGTFQLLPWLYSNYGNDGVNVDDLTADSAVKGLSVLGDLAANGALSTECVSWTQSDAWNQFVAGKAAMSMMGTWHLALADDIDFNYDVVLLPTGDEGTTTSCVGGENFGVCTGATEKEACIDFLEYLCSAENEAIYAEAAGKLSVRSDAEVEYGYSQDKFETFQEQLSYATARGPHAEWPTISEAIYTAGQDVITNGADPATALATAMETINPILEENPLP